MKTQCFWAGYPYKHIGGYMDKITKLLKRVKPEAEEKGCFRLWITYTEESGYKVSLYKAEGLTELGELICCDDITAYTPYYEKVFKEADADKIKPTLEDITQGRRPFIACGEYDKEENRHKLLDVLQELHCLVI